MNKDEKRGRVNGLSAMEMEILHLLKAAGPRGEKGRPLSRRANAAVDRLLELGHIHREKNCFYITEEGERALGASWWDREEEHARAGQLPPGEDRR